MKTFVVAVTAVVLVLAGAPGHASATAPEEAAPRPSGAVAATVLLPGAPRPLPRATDEPSATPSADPSASPTPAGRRPVDEEGDRWVNLATIAGIGLIGTVVAFMITGALMRRRSRRREG